MTSIVDSALKVWGSPSIRKKRSLDSSSPKKKKKHSLGVFKFGEAHSTGHLDVDSLAESRKRSSTIGSASSLCRKRSATSGSQLSLSRNSSSTLSIFSEPPEEVPMRRKRSTYRLNSGPPHGILNKFLKVNGSAVPPSKVDIVNMTTLSPLVPSNASSDYKVVILTTFTFQWHYSKCKCILRPFQLKNSYHYLQLFICHLASLLLIRYQLWIGF